MTLPPPDQLLEVLARVAEEERWALIEDQQAARLAPSNAIRPLFPHELEAGVRFADLEDDRDAAVAQAEALLSQLHAEAADAILVGLFGESRQGRLTPEEAVEVIHHLHAEQPDQVGESERSVAGLLAAILLGAYILSGRRTVEEAQRQGVNTTGVLPAQAQVEDFAASAAGVTTHPWRRIIGKVEEELTSQSTIGAGEVTHETVTQVLDGIATDGSVDQARQAVNVAAGEGRLETVQSEPTLSDHMIFVFASELMDGATCESCAAVDGKQYEDMDEALEDYPRGMFIDCDGGTRCRGTLLFIYN